MPDADNLKGIEAAFKDRETLGHWAGKKVEKGEMRDYQKEWNSHSLDGLPGLQVALRDAGERVWVARTKAWARRMGAEKDAVGLGVLLGFLMLLLWQTVMAKVHLMY